MRLAMGSQYTLFQNNNDFIILLNLYQLALDALIPARNSLNSKDAIKASRAN